MLQRLNKLYSIKPWIPASVFPQMNPVSWQFFFFQESIFRQRVSFKFDRTDFFSFFSYALHNYHFFKEDEIDSEETATLCFNKTFSRKHHGNYQLHVYKLLIAWKPLLEMLLNIFVKKEAQWSETVLYKLRDTEIFLKHLVIAESVTWCYITAR